MSTTTIDDQLAEVRRRIERLQARASAVSSPESVRPARCLAGLRRMEISARAAAHDDPGALGEKLAQLNARLDVAEHSLAVDVAADRAAFAAAIDAELRSWDTYLERLQMSVAAKASLARERSETAIGRIRACRIAVDEHLSDLRADSGDAWPHERRRVTEACTELERRADALSAKLTTTQANSKEQRT